MLCDICHEKPAKIFYTEIINGVKKEQHLCEDCASEHTVFSLKDKLGNDIPIGNVLTGILNSYTKNLKAKPASEIICTRCGMTMSEVIKSGHLGCPECYNTFALFLDKNLKTIHGTNEHHGKEPLNADKLPYRPRGMKDQQEGTSQDQGNASDAAKGMAPQNGYKVTLHTKKVTEEELEGILNGNKSTPLAAEVFDEVIKKKKPAKKGIDAEMQQDEGKTVAASSKVESEKPKPTVEGLRAAMNEAVAEEDYATAARMRDLMHALQKEQEKAVQNEAQKAAKKAASKKKTSVKTDSVKTAAKPKKTVKAEKGPAPENTGAEKQQAPKEKGNSDGE